VTELTVTVLRFDSGAVALRVTRSTARAATILANTQVKKEGYHVYEIEDVVAVLQQQLFEDVYNAESGAVDQPPLWDNRGEAPEVPLR
jgi:hypothetical protein